MIELLGLLVVVGVLALYRWSSWVVRYIIGRTYKPIEKEYSCSVSVVVPVFNEGVLTLSQCLRSILDNKPDEVIVVIQQPKNNTFEECLKLCKELQVKTIVTQKYGKRPALAVGIKETKNDIIALVDSDVKWSIGLLKKAIKSFNDKTIGSVLVSTRALNPEKWHQYLMDIIWDLRNKVEFPFLAKFGVASVISGRTALHRKQILINSLEDFLSEKFCRIELKSGDDKFFTRILMKSKMKMAYQPTTVYSEVPISFVKMVKQFVRWQRNSWRSDLKFILSRTAIRKDRIVLTTYLLDRMLGKFILVIGTILAVYTIISNVLGGSIIILGAFTTWWVLTRILKITVGTKKITKISLIYVPWIVLGALLSIWACLTINDTGWHTREGWKGVSSTPAPLRTQQPIVKNEEGMLVLAAF